MARRDFSQCARDSKMGFYISWSIEGEKQLSRNLMIAADRVKDWTPAFKESAEYLKEVFSNEVFDTQGAVIGEHWSPLSKAYALQKARKHPGKGLLEATGDMRNGFLTLWRPDMAAVWNKMDYFKYHQSNQPRHVLPRRVMMKIGEYQKEIVVKVFQDHFRNVMTNL